MTATRHALDVSMHSLCVSQYAEYYVSAAASSYDPEPAENYADAPSRGWEPAGAYSKSS